MSMFRFSSILDVSPSRWILHTLGFWGLLLAGAPCLASTAQSPAQTQDSIHAAPAQAAPAKVEKYALLVGITNYGGNMTLKGCINDVDDIKASLVRNFGFQNDGTHILMLENEAATRRGIIEAFRSQLTANAKKHPNGVFLFYFSGHGSQTFDTNGDEKQEDPSDTLDETLVPFDWTRDPKDHEHFDLIDDEIGGLYDELQSVPNFTGQLTSIFDCCHSGTATRGAQILGDSQSHIKGITADSRLYPEDKMLNEDKMLSAKGITADSRRYPGKSSPTDSRVHPGGNTSNKPLYFTSYAAFSGSMSNETSTEQPFAGVWHGALTYHLLHAMDDASQQTTNGAIWRRVTQALSRLDQSPQLEGATNHPFLGGSSHVVAPPVLYSRRGDILTIARGVEGGAVKGGFVELFAPQNSVTKGAAQNPVGISAPATAAAGRGVFLGCFQIAAASVGSSQVAIPAIRMSIPAQGTAQLITPYFGNQPIHVGLGDLSNGPVAQRLQQFTKNNNLVQLAAPGEMADLTLVASTYSEAFPRGRPRETTPHSADECGYFVSVRPGAPPLFSAWFQALPNLPNGDLSDADASELCKALENFAVQTNIIALTNTAVGAQKLGQAVQLEVFKVPGRMEGEEYVADWKRMALLKPDATGTFDVKDQDRLEFHLSNQTDRRLYVALLWLSQDGSINAVPDAHSDKIMTLKPRSYEDSTAKSHIYRVNPPYGTETLKLLVSSQPIDATVFERERVDRKGGSVFESLLGQALNTRGPMSNNGDSVRFDGWAVADFHLVIQAATNP